MAPAYSVGDHRKEAEKVTMEDYKTLVKELIEDHIKDTQSWDNSKTRKQDTRGITEDTENVFGNIDGSRTYGTYKAQQFIDKSGAIWDTDIHDLFSDIDDDYFFNTLKRGAGNTRCRYL